MFSVEKSCFQTVIRSEICLGVKAGGWDLVMMTCRISAFSKFETVIRSLEVAATKPADTVFSFRAQVLENAAISFLFELGILDGLVSRQGAEVTAAELAAETSSNELLIVRLMRVASALQFCEETSESTYRATHLTPYLTTPGFKGGLRWTETFFPIVSKIPSYLAESDFRLTGGEPTQTAFQFTHGKPAWEVINEPHLRHEFDLWMRERKKHDERSWHKRYPPSAELAKESLKTGEDAVLVVDIGGASGSQLVDFRTQFPGLPGRFVLQDIQPPTMEGVAEGVEVMVYDFFTPQPVRGARFYYFRSVFHNWSDEKCAEILRNVVDAMDPDYSTLLIEDYVLPARETQLRGAVEDILMMVVLNSLERTAKQYEDILHAAGLDIVNIYAVGANEEGIIEARITKGRW
ncbi:S-adenosyl-L-methionine-dependent methyltransferase [Bombardia bombarda]|uniref:S-adenosyl-L-methionine-dependent methyltransferase n=1 Tax=Bombardia bombarda TaxID=252184 RepID=A0AA40C865_9PEZI|nr:S-adenosyl-L-methionine-dependent methyltransferase [Bombardia bombarda]